MLKAAETVRTDRDDCSLAIGDLQNLYANQDTILQTWITAPARVSFVELGADVLVAHARPYVLANTVAVHVLTTTPLTDARGKMDVAKELMLWPGAYDYYAVGRSAPGYLVYKDNLLSTSPAHQFHDWRWLNAILVHLVFLARLTKRILVLPTIFDFQRFHYTADHIDLESLESLLGGDRSWRESTFFANPRLDVLPGATACTLRVGPGSKVHVSERRTFCADDIRYAPTARTYDLSQATPRKRRALDLWAIALGDENAKLADVLVLDMNNMPEREVWMAQCFHGNPDWSCQGPVNSDLVPRELALVQARLRWYNSESSYGEDENFYFPCSSGAAQSSALSTSRLPMAKHHPWDTSRPRPASFG
jgi:hypothetical protein